MTAKNPFMQVDFECKSVEYYLLSLLNRNFHGVALTVVFTDITDCSWPFCRCAPSARCADPAPKASPYTVSLRLSSSVSFAAFLGQGKEGAGGGLCLHVVRAYLGVCVCVLVRAYRSTRVCVCVHDFYWCCIVNRLVKSNRKPRLVAVVAAMGRVDGGGAGRGEQCLDPCKAVVGCCFVRIVSPSPRPQIWNASVRRGTVASWAAWWIFLSKVSTFLHCALFFSPCQKGFPCRGLLWLKQAQRGVALSSCKGQICLPVRFERILQISIRNHKN